jgi:acyl-CoA reductase-like NAD-dependent aldehyde dehydrogenase
LCAKCDVLVKDREDSLVRAFFETLAEELDEFAEAARAAVWSSEDLHAPELQNFDAVVAYGGDGALSKIRPQLQPQARFIAYGPRASAGYVTRESLQSAQTVRDVAAGAARDLVLYESEGCLSLHVLFVERGGAISPDDFAKTLADAVERANVEFPVGRREPQTTARLAHERNLSAFRAAAGTGAVFANTAADYTVVLDPPKEEPPQFLPRALGVIPVDDAAQALAYLSAHCIPLEGFALSSDRADVLEIATKAGAVRLTRFGELQHPPLAGDHGGRPRIAEFVRWIDKTL